MIELNKDADKLLADKKNDNKLGKYIAFLRLIVKTGIEVESIQAIKLFVNKHEGLLKCLSRPENLSEINSRI